MYFGDMEIVDHLNNEEAGELFRAILAYAQYGVVPVFTAPSLGIAWIIIRNQIDKDTEAYHSKIVNSSYAVYCREEKKAGRVPTAKEEWLHTYKPDSIERYQTVSDDSERYQTASNTNNNSSSSPNNNTSNNTSLSTEERKKKEALRRWKDKLGSLSPYQIEEFEYFFSKVGADLIQMIDQAAASGYTGIVATSVIGQWIADKETL